MTKFIRFSIILGLFVFNTYSFGQGISLGVGGGITSIQSPDAFTKDVSAGGANFGSEYHIGVKAKLNVPLIPITPYGFLQYHMLRGDGSINGVAVETSQNIFSLGVGGQMGLIPGPLSPFLLLDVSYNNFGDFEVSGGGLNSTTSGNSRFGLGIGAGVELTLLPIDFEVTGKYNFFNLVGKESGEETVGAFIVSAHILFGS